MNNISVCIDMMFSHLDFADRITAVKECGIDTVEFWKWSNKDIDAIVESGVNVSIFNMDSSDEALSYDLSRGILNAGRVEEFVSALEESIPVYKKLGASAMIVLIGENAEYSEENCLKCLEAAKPILKENGVTLIPPYVDAQTGNIIVSVSKVLSDGESVLALDITPYSVQEATEAMNLNGNGYGFVLWVMTQVFHAQFKESLQLRAIIQGVAAHPFR
jgi:hypothetical protein